MATCETWRWENNCCRKDLRFRNTLIAVDRGARMLVVVE